MEWTSLAALVVSVAAAVLSLFGYRIQRVAHLLTTKQQYASLILRLQEIQETQEAAGRRIPPAGQPEGADPATRPATPFQHQSLHHLAQQAEALQTTGKITPTWLDTLTLAVAFTQVWDYEGATPHWQRLGTNLSGSAMTSTAKIDSLIARAGFYVSRAERDDAADARKDLAQVLRTLEETATEEPPDSYRDRAVLVGLRCAHIESGIGDLMRVAGWTGRAYKEALAIQMPWRRERAVHGIAQFITEVRLPEQDRPQLLLHTLEWREFPNDHPPADEPLRSALDHLRAPRRRAHN